MTSEKKNEMAKTKVEGKADTPKVADKKTETKKLAIPMAKMVVHVKSAGDLPKVADAPKTNAPKADAPKVHEDAKVHAKIEDVSKPADDEKIEYPKVKKPSAGKQIRDLFQLAISKKLIADNVVIDLQSAEFCKTKLKIRYPFLMMTTTNNDDRKINGCYRYLAKSVEIAGKNYWVTNDLYARQVDIFRNWVMSLG